MRALTGKFFGNTPTSISARFSLNGQVTRGFIIRQTGTARYLVSDATTIKSVTLVRSMADAQLLYSAEGTTLPSRLDGYATIAITHGGGTYYAEKILYNQVLTCDGLSLNWRLSPEQGGCEILRIGIPTPSFDLFDPLDFSAPLSSTTTPFI